MKRLSWQQKRICQQIKRCIIGLLFTKALHLASQKSNLESFLLHIWLKQLLILSTKVGYIGNYICGWLGKTCVRLTKYPLESHGQPSTQENSIEMRPFVHRPCGINVVMVWREKRPHFADHSYWGAVKITGLIHQWDQARNNNYSEWLNNQVVRTEITHIQTVKYGFNKSGWLTCCQIYQIITNFVSKLSV